jgi:hypothetical protein
MFLSDKLLESLAGQFDTTNICTIQLACYLPAH